MLANPSLGIILSKEQNKTTKYDLVCGPCVSIVEKANLFPGRFSSYPFFFKLIIY